MKAVGRGGWGVGFALSYNSQLWRQDGGTTWEMGRDLGYGYGWRMMAGSITPYWSGYYTLDHYIYTDSTGAEYVLGLNTNGIWSSTGTGVYVEYDSAAQRLYFPDGHFWIMGATSSGLEDDAGSLYPTVMEDTNGNQVVVHYRTGYGAGGANSSARIDQIFDLRGGAPPSGTPTYAVNWAGTSPDFVSSITNSIGSAEYYQFSTGTATRVSPFDGSSFGAKGVLNSISRSNLYGTTGLTHHFTYNGSGELTAITLPYGATLRWDYRSFTYAGSRTMREVQYRYLTKAPGATETTYTFYHDDTGSSLVHSWGAVQDPSGPGRAWYFFTDGTGPLGANQRYEARPTIWAAPILQRVFTYAPDASGRNYVNSVTKIIEPSGANLQARTVQTLDVHGNATQSVVYGYASQTTPLRTYNTTYWSYAPAHIWNRVSISTITDGTNKRHPGQQHV